MPGIWLQLCNRIFYCRVFLIYTVTIETEVRSMFGNNKKVSMTEDEKTILILALNELRNKLISENTYTDAVDELILKLAC